MLPSLYQSATARPPRCKVLKPAPRLRADAMFALSPLLLASHATVQGQGEGQRPGHGRLAWDDAVDGLGGLEGFRSPAGVTTHTAFNERGVMAAGWCINLTTVVGRATGSDRNPLIREDRLWESNFAFPSVSYDPSGEAPHPYEAWWLNIVFDNKGHTDPHPPPGFPDRMRLFSEVYAHSDDGIRWTQPALGRVEFNNATDNNLLLLGINGIGVWRDRRDANASRRYKGIGAFGNCSYARPCRAPQGCCTPAKLAPGHVPDCEAYRYSLAFSADGVTWRDADMHSIGREIGGGECGPTEPGQPPRPPCVPGIGSRWDTQSNLLYDTESERCAPRAPVLVSPLAVRQ